MKTDSVTQDAVTSGVGVRDPRACGEVTVKEIDSPEPWDAFVAASPAAELYHDYRWRSLIERVFGHECRYLCACDPLGRIRGVLPLVRLKSRLFGDFFVSVPYFNYGGVLADSTNVEQALVEYAARLGRELGVAHIELRHRAHQELTWHCRGDKVTMLLDLPADEASLSKTLGSKLRAQIRRPQKAGAVCRSGGAELLGDFYSVFARNMRDLGTPVYSTEFFAAIIATFPQHARLFVVDLGGKPVAAGFTLTHRGTMQIPWASSLREANHHGVNMLLYWETLCGALAAGCQAFDFGRSTRDSGTYRFKEQWGAQPRQLRWHYWLAEGTAPPLIAPSNPKYKLAIALWQRLPVPVANFLGPHIVKNLP